MSWSSGVSGIPTSEKGVANGVASLDATGKVPAAQLPTTTTVVMKTLAESVNNSTTLQNDDELLAAVEANKRYLVELYLVVTGVSVNADLKVGFTVPAGGSYQFNRLSNWSVATTATPSFFSTTTVSAGVGAGTFGSAFYGTVTIGATAGTLQMQWAQDAAVAENVTLEAGSMMRLTKLN